MASYGTVQGKKKGGPAGGRPIATDQHTGSGSGPPVPAHPNMVAAAAKPGMTAARGRATRVLTDAQRRRRTIRQALGIADVRKATTSQLTAARGKGGFLNRGQVKRQRTAVRPTSVSNTGTSYGAAPTMKVPKRRKSL